MEILQNTILQLTLNLINTGVDPETLINTGVDPETLKRGEGW